MSNSSQWPAQDQNDKRTYLSPTIEAVKLNTKEVLLGGCQTSTANAEGLACTSQTCEYAG